MKALTPENDLPADDRRIRAVPRAPRIVRQHGHRTGARSGRIIRQERTSHEDGRAEHLKVVAADEAAGDRDVAIHDRDNAACREAQKNGIRSRNASTSASRNSWRRALAVSQLSV